MACFSEQAQTLFKDWKQDQLLADLERDHTELVERQVASIHYGGPNALTPKKRTMLNSQGHCDSYYPPAIFVYGIETHCKIICSYVPIARLRRAIADFSSRLIANIVSPASGLYSDGWAGPRLRWLFPAGATVAK